MILMNYCLGSIIEDAATQKVLEEPIMSDLNEQAATPSPDDSSTDSIPYGYCHCGCGQKTKISPANDHWHGWVKGVPRKFARRHHDRRSKVPFEIRFWRKVEKSSKKNGCWLWMGSRYNPPWDYGLLKIDNKTKKAHRVAYELSHGSISDDLDVCHTCDNPPCVRPDHLFAGSGLENIQDRNRKGRQAKGEKIHTAKLTENDVLEIRSLRGKGMTYVELSESFGVGVDYMGALCRGKYWRHLL
jgi:hypothetical protein